MDEVKLLPCAHCGSPDGELRESITDAYVACNNCGCRTGLVYLGPDDASNAYRKREVAEVWNTRPTLVTDELVERLREWLKAIAELAQSPDVDPLAFMDLVGKGAAGLHGELASMPTLVTGQLEGEVERLTALLNTPEVDDFAKGAVLEAAHQRERWGADHDAGKSPFDWFWLVGYLAQKAAASAVAGDIEKAKHHTISTAAALANWHLALSGTDNRMVPGAPLPVINQADAA